MGAVWRNIVTGPNKLYFPKMSLLWALTRIWFDPGLYLKWRLYKELITSTENQHRDSHNILTVVVSNILLPVVTVLLLSLVRFYWTNGWSHWPIPYQSKWTLNWVCYVFSTFRIKHNQLIRLGLKYYFGAKFLISVLLMRSGNNVVTHLCNENGFRFRSEYHTCYFWHEIGFDFSPELTIIWPYLFNLKYFWHKTDPTELIEFYRNRISDYHHSS